MVTQTARQTAKRSSQTGWQLQSCYGFTAFKKFVKRRTNHDIDETSKLQDFIYPGNPQNARKTTLIRWLEPEWKRPIEAELIRWLPRLYVAKHSISKQDIEKWKKGMIELLVQLLHSNNSLCWQIICNNWGRSEASKEDVRRTLWWLIIQRTCIISLVSCHGVPWNCLHTQGEQCLTKEIHWYIGIRTDHCQSLVFLFQLLLPVIWWNCGSVDTVSDHQFSLF